MMHAKLDNLYTNGQTKIDHNLTSVVQSRCLNESVQEWNNILKPLLMFSYVYSETQVCASAAHTKHVFTNLSTWAGCNTMTIFWADFKKFEFSVFILLCWWPNQG